MRSLYYLRRAYMYSEIQIIQKLRICKQSGAFCKESGIILGSKNRNVICETRALLIPARKHLSHPALLLWTTAILQPLLSQPSPAPCSRPPNRLSAYRNPLKLVLSTRRHQSKKNCVHKLQDYSYTISEALLQHPCLVDLGMRSWDLSKLWNTLFCLEHQPGQHSMLHFIPHT